MVRTAFVYVCLEAILLSAWRPFVDVQVVRVTIFQWVRSTKLAHAPMQPHWQEL